MARMSIDVSNVRDAAKLAGQVASHLETYANIIDNRVGGKLDSLTGGHSGNTRTAKDLAASKSRSIRQRITKYQKLQSNLNSFANNAETRDTNVYNKFHAAYKSHYDQLSNWEKFRATIYRFFNNAVGGSKFGQNVMGIVNAAKIGEAALCSGIQTAVRWFQYGNGRYVLEIVIGVAAAVAAVVALCNPVTGPLAIVAIVAGTIAAIYSVSKAVVGLIDNADAIATSGTDPGLARYKGGTSLLLDFAKKHFNNKTVQQIAGVADVIGITAGLIKSGCDFFKTPEHLAKNKDVTEYKFSWDNFKANFKESWGFKYNETTKSYKHVGLKDWVKDGLGWKTLKQGDSDIKSATKITKDIKVATKDFQSLVNFVNGESKWSDATQTVLKNAAPVKDYYGMAKDIGDLGKTAGTINDLNDLYSSESKGLSSISSKYNKIVKGTFIDEKISSNGGNIFKDVSGQKPRNYTTSGLTTGLTSASVDSNVYSKTTSGLLNASRVSTLPDVGYTCYGSGNPNASVITQFGMTGDLLPATSATMDRAIYRTALALTAVAA